METTEERGIAASRAGLARLSVDQFHRMIEAGILPEGAAIELIDGVLIRKDSSDSGGDSMTHGPRHAYFLQRVVRWAEHALDGSAFHVRQQLPLVLGASEPEPDVALVRGTFETYRDRHPVAVECGAVIEVADSSLDYDRDVKAPIYAAAGVGAYWIVNVGDRVVEAHTGPVVAERRYAQRSLHRPGETLALRLSTDVLFELDAALLLK